MGRIAPLVKYTGQLSAISAGTPRKKNYGILPMQYALGLSEVLTMTLNKARNLERALSAVLEPFPDLTVTVTVTDSDFEVSASSGDTLLIYRKVPARHRSAECLLRQIVDLDGARVAMIAENFDLVRFSSSGDLAVGVSLRDLHICTERLIRPLA